MPGGREGSIPREQKILRVAAARGPADRSWRRPSSTSPGIGRMDCETSTVVELLLSPTGLGARDAAAINRVPAVTGDSRSCLPNRAIGERVAADHG